MAPIREPSPGDPRHGTISLPERWSAVCRDRPGLALDFGMPPCQRLKSSGMTAVVDSSSAT